MVLEAKNRRTEIKNTIADKFAARLQHDGQNFETDEGQSFEDLANQLGADITYSTRIYDDDGDLHYIDGYKSCHISGDPVRYGFADGSAVVVSGPAWDVEGEERYSWSGA